MITADYQVHSTLHAMRQIVNLVPRSFHRFIAGTVPLDRTLRMVTKFMMIYGIAEPRALERRRRRRHEANARLVLCPDGRLEDGRIRWVMLVSDRGGGLITEREHLLDARDKRHRIRVGWYELVRAPRPGAMPSWTWRVPPREWAAHVEHAVVLAHYASPEQAQQLIDHEMRRPGFRGIRQQRRQLFRAMALARGRRQPPLVFPTRPSPWVGMLRSNGVRLGNLAAAAQLTPPHGPTSLEK